MYVSLAMAGPDLKDWFSWQHGLCKYSPHAQHDSTCTWKHKHQGTACTCEATWLQPSVVRHRQQAAQEIKQVNNKFSMLPYENNPQNKGMHLCAILNKCDLFFRCKQPCLNESPIKPDCGHWGRNAATGCLSYPREAPQMPPARWGVFGICTGIRAASAKLALTTTTLE